MTTRISTKAFQLGLLLTPVLFADNPVISHRHLADPNGFVFNNRIYAVCSNDDDNGSGYDMKSAVVISTNDLMNWTDHGDAFRTTRDAKWAAGSYAPTAIAAKGKVYFYFPNIASGVGVLIADRPEGPYKDPLGHALISGSTQCPMAWCFDPVIFVDDDAAASAYLIWGGGTPYGSNFRGTALGADMISVKGSLTTPNTPNSFEGPFVHKYKGNYYLHYPINGNSNIEYSMSSTSPISGYSRQGVLLPNPTLNGKNINFGNNSHESVFLYKGNWYMMYHDRRLPDGSTYKRDVSIDKIEYNTDGTMKQVVVTSGMAQLANFNPYDSIPAATMSAQSGIKANFDATAWVNYLIPQTSGSWTRISGVDFGTGGAKQFQVNASTTGTGVGVEVHTGSATGALAATCSVSGSAFATSKCDVTGLTGVKDIYLKYVGTTANTRFAWYRFVPMNTDAIRRSAFGPATPASTTDYVVYDIGGHQVSRFSAGANVEPSAAWVDNSRNLATGTYLVKVTSAQGQRVQKFVRAANPVR